MEYWICVLTLVLLGIITFFHFRARGRVDDFFHFLIVQVHFCFLLIEFQSSFSISLPCGLGIRIQPTFALVRVVRVD